MSAAPKGSEDVDTLVAPSAKPSSPAPASAPSVGGGASLSTSDDDAAAAALHEEEASRAAIFGRAVAVLCGIGLVVHVVFIRNDSSWRYWLFAATLIVLGTVGAWVARRAGQVETYTSRVFRVFGLACIAGAFVFQAYLGVFSPVGVVIGLGVSFFGLGEDTRFINAFVPFVVLAYFGFAVLVALGVVPDYGMIRPAAAGIGARVSMAVMVNVVYIVTFWNARRSRAATIRALERSNEAVRMAQRHEAQLAEANQRLDVALRAGAGLEGRYSRTRAGEYDLGHVVGRGAMGEVYEAKHATTGRAAAVKLLHAAALDDEEIAARFFREARIAMSLRSPHVVEVFDVGKTSDGAPFFAMELLRGNDLAWHLRQRQLLPLAEVVVLAGEVAAGLDAAHAGGVVHRDLKPQNVFFAESKARPAWKIVDFGVSKLQEGSGTLTGVGTIVGTPGYMSPEQAKGEKTDHRVDVFALGAVTYRALTGTPAFGGSSPPQILYDVVFRVPVRPSELLPDVPRDVEAVLALALAKRPEDRFASAKELAAALRAAATGTLDAKTRKRARAQILREPWGKLLRDEAPRRGAGGRKARASFMGSTRARKG
jgi:eukaryotic-like serine/threonine-protein kinase